MSPFLRIFLQLIQLEESCKLVAYKDSLGIWTIGWGYNLIAHGYEPEQCEGLTWTQEQADAALAEEVEQAIANLDRLFPTWRHLDVVRQTAVVSSMYQLGAGKVVQFKETIAALKAHDWELAATRMLNSRWAKQTPARVRRNADMIRTGQWPQEVNGVRFLPETGADAPAEPAAEAPAPAEPVAPVLQAQGLRDGQDASPAVVESVGDVVAATPGLGALITAVTKLLGKHPSTYGAGGLFTMLVGNFRMKTDIFIFNHYFHFEDAAAVVAMLAVGAVVWGVLRKGDLLSGISKTMVSLLLVGLLVLPGCAGFHPSGAGPEAAGLRADGPSAAETTEAPTKSTLPERLKAGVDWLWASVVALRAQGVSVQDLDELRAIIIDISRLSRGGAQDAALALWQEARAIVTALAKEKAS